MKNHKIEVSSEIKERVKKSAGDLAELGIGVHVEHTTFTRAHPHHRREGGRLTKSGEGHVDWQTISHLWLVFSISKAAIEGWPKIQGILEDAGLVNDEITQLRLACAEEEKATPESS
jgi:hypothetical protein